MNIRSKVILTACLLICLFVGMFLLGQGLFLKSYYVFRNRFPFHETYQEIAQYSESPVDVFLSRLRHIGSETGYKLSVVNKQGGIELSSSPEFEHNNSGHIPREHQIILAEWAASSNDSSPYYGIVERRSELSEIILISRLNPGRFLIVSLPLKQLEANAEIAFTFSILTGVVLLLLSVLPIAFLSERAIRPVRKITELSASIADLDFSKRYYGSSGDELETLGLSMNRIAENLSAAMDAMEKDIVLQRRFLAGLAHELKTPLGLIRGYAEAITIGKASSTVQINEFSNIIIDETDRLDRMVRDILLIGKLEGNGFILRFEKTDLVPVIKESALAFSTLNRRIRTFVPDHLTVSCDRDRIRQVFDILLSNAFQHSLPDAIVTISGEQVTDHHRFEVQNEGSNIPAEHIPHLFKAFYRVQDSRNRMTGGTGLGLSIAKGLVEAHHGEIGIQNTDSGPSFWFTLPACSE